MCEHAGIDNKLTKPGPRLHRPTSHIAGRSPDVNSIATRIPPPQARMTRWLEGCRAEVWGVLERKNMQEAGSLRSITVMGSSRSPWRREREPWDRMLVTPNVGGMASWVIFGARALTRRLEQRFTHILYWLRARCHQVPSSEPAASSRATAFFQCKYVSRHLVMTG